MSVLPNATGEESEHPYAPGRIHISPKRRKKTGRPLGLLTVVEAADETICANSKQIGGIVSDILYKMQQVVRGGLE